MTINVLFAQRICRYEGEYGPEVLAVTNNHQEDDNPDYMRECLANAQNSGEFIAAKVLSFKVDDKVIDQHLNPTPPTIEATLIPPSA